MSDCMNGGRFRYAKGHGTPTGTAMGDVMRGKLVFDDGFSMPLTFARHNGRRVDHFEMDGVLFERVRMFEQLDGDAREHHRETEELNERIVELELLVRDIDHCRMLPDCETCEYYGRVVGAARCALNIDERMKALGIEVD